MLKYTVHSNLNKKKMKELLKMSGEDACKSIVDNIYDESQKNCAVRTGKLKASGYKKQTKYGWDVGYTAPYAVYVDKMPQKSFDRTGNGGKTHFFTAPLMKYRWGKGVDGNDL